MTAPFNSLLNSKPKELSWSLEATHTFCQIKTSFITPPNPQTTRPYKAICVLSECIQYWGRGGVVPALWQFPKSPPSPPSPRSLIPVSRTMLLVIGSCWPWIWPWRNGIAWGVPAQFPCDHWQFQTRMSLLNTSIPNRHTGPSSSTASNSLSHAGLDLRTPRQMPSPSFILQNPTFYQSWDHTSTIIFYHFHPVGPRPGDCNSYHPSPCSSSYPQKCSYIPEQEIH